MWWRGRFAPFSELERGVEVSIWRWSSGGGVEVVTWWAGDISLVA